MKSFSSLLFFLSSVIVCLAATTAGTQDTQPLKLFVGLAATGDTIGTASVRRSLFSRDVDVSVKINELPQGVYTFWVTVLEQGVAPPFASLGGSYVAENAVTSEVSIELTSKTLKEVSISSCSEDGFPPLPPFSNIKGKIEIVVVNHGIPEDFNAIPSSWLTNFWTGESAICGGECGNPGPGWCPNYAASMHTYTALERPDSIDDEGGGGTCFSSNTMVQVKGKGAVVIKDVKKDDHVLASSGKFERATFGHFHSKEEATFLQFQLAKQESQLEMTPSHLVFLFGKTNPVRADSVKVGDALLASDGTAAKVVLIKSIQHKGVYTLFTESGTIVADGIVASSYVSVEAGSAEYAQLGFGLPFAPSLSHQDLAHIALSPFRMLCMGVSSSFCSVSQEDGVPHYAVAMMKLKGWAQKQNTLVEAIVIIFTLVLASTSMFLETLFGATYAPMVVVALTTIIAIVTRNPFIGHCSMA